MLGITFLPPGNVATGLAAMVLINAGLIMVIVLGVASGQIKPGYALVQIFGGFVLAVVGMSVAELIFDVMRAEFDPPVRKFVIPAHRTDALPVALLAAIIDAAVGSGDDGGDELDLDDDDLDEGNTAPHGHACGRASGATRTFIDLLQEDRE